MNDLRFRDNNFDLIRLLAALQVAFLHGWEHLEMPATAYSRWMIQIMGLFPGVPIFFVISGFLISASFERSPGVRFYSKNRFLRIYPGLWGCFLVSLITVALFYSPHVSIRSFLPWVVAQLSIGQFYNPDFLRGYGVGTLNGSLWTIPIEIQFYLLLPVLYGLFRGIRWNAIFLGLMIAGLAGINVYYARLDVPDAGMLVKLFGVTVIPYLYIFLIGVFLQRNREFVARVLKGRVFLWLVVYIVAGYVLGMLGIRVRGNLLNPLSALILAFLTVSFAYSRDGSLARILRGNDISYGVYIYHMVVFNALIHFGFKHDAWALALGMFIVVAAALLSWKYIEKPAMRLKRYSVKMPG